MQSTQSIPVVVQQVRPAPVQLVPAHPTAYTHALTGCGRSLSYLFAAIALTAVAVLHLLDLLLGISGGIESVWAAIDASPSGLMQFLQAAFWLPELLTVIVMAEAAMQIIGLAMYWVAPYLDYDIALQLYGMFGYLNGSVLLHMFSLLFSAVSGILFSVVTLRYRREVSAAMEAE